MKTERDEFVTLFAAALQGINAHGESREAVSLASRQAKEAMDELKNRFPHYINDVDREQKQFAARLKPTNGEVER